ncbi:hypothetical protein [Mycolicibacterium aubagnense]|uniref:Uncharacterized protein n=1 Tax=Mycolicibacterium aubagnense TaxID=319707 RepID=A0ABM7IJ91_9MYCO|nr:hypothetical protein [Mycolicibacterium aubagnense]TLH66733.1 hypothetical protein C1S80_06590 [Mycolicibacterium aubagnense]WGI31678.1 hypothetical protein QDT91_20980 [Mycolicibacterium aubagnense]BBX86841.1 hypothetical protein MAUB_47140 [Mycolicibacterium aubagnense]
MSGNEQQQQTAADASNDRTNQGDSIGDLAPSHEESVGVKGGGLQVGTWHGSGGGAGKGQ